VNRLRANYFAPRDENISVFIGYDSAQDSAYKTCAYSIRKHSGHGVHIFPLNHKDLRSKGLFNRPWLTKEDGIKVDVRDGRPFSTDFSHTRFLTPEYFDYLGLNYDKENRWAIFVDSDFLFLSDVRQMIASLGKNPRPLSVVKHEYRPKTSVKMDGAPQEGYNYKLWSSLMIFDMYQWDSDEHIDANMSSGSDLHSFDWYPQGVDNIGQIPESWNFIPNHSEKNTLTIDAIHYTEGLPVLKGYEDAPKTSLWWRYYQEMLLNEANSILKG